MAVEATREKSPSNPLIPSEGRAQTAASAVSLGLARGLARGLAQRLALLIRTATAAPLALLPGAGSVTAAMLLMLVVAFALDRPIAAAMRHLPGTVTRFFQDVTILGEGWVWMVPIAIVGLILARVSFAPASRKKRARLVLLAERAFFMFSAIAVPSLATTILKHLVGRVRPRYFESLGVFHFEPFSLAASKASFPSGHATTAAALIIAISAVAPRWRRPVAALATMVFLSRVAVEAHYVSDVLAGALIGIAGARAMLTLFAEARVGLRSGAAPKSRTAQPGGPFAAVGAGRAGDLPQGHDAPATWARGISSETSPAPRLSIVVPMRNEVENAGPLIEEIERECAALAPFEIICVDDGSSDGTAARLAELGAGRASMRALRHGETCGQSAAVRSGVRAARAPIVATLDGDGQNDPAFIPRLVEALETSGPGTGLVAGQRIGRKDTGFKKLQSRVANAVRGRILQDGTRDTGCGLKAFRREAFLALPYFDGLHRFLPALMRREGYGVNLVDVVDRPRRAGRSNYGLFDRLWVGILDLAGVWWLIRRRRRTPIVSELQKDA